MQRKESSRAHYFLSIAACLVYGCHLLLAQSDLSRWPEFHREDLSKWAAKTGKSARFLDELSKAAISDDAKGLKEGYFPYTIENVDTQTLSQRGHILLSIWAAGTGHCLTLYVLKGDGNRFEKVWQSYDNLCTRSILGAAETQAMSDGKIIVKYWQYSVDSDSKKDVLPIQRVTITYKWDGTAYINVGRTERPEPSFDFDAPEFPRLELLDLGETYEPIPSAQLDEGRSGLQITLRVGVRLQNVSAEHVLALDVSCFNVEKEVFPEPLVGPIGGGPHYGFVAESPHCKNLGLQPKIVRIMPGKSYDITERVKFRILYDSPGDLRESINPGVYYLGVTITTPLSWDIDDIDEQTPVKIDEQTPVKSWIFGPTVSALMKFNVRGKPKKT